MPRNEKIEFAIMLAQEFPKAANLAETAAQLMRLARRHGRMQEHRCNFQWLDTHERAEARLEAKILALCEALGCKVILGGDPRGYTVKLLLPSGRSNTWGGAEDGWGVPQ